MGYGARIKHRREAMGLSQQELASRCGWTSRNRISQYELEQREPKGGDFEKLARVLGTTASWLRFGSVEQKATSDDFDIDANMLSKILTLVAQVEEEHKVRLDAEAKAALITALYEDAKAGSAPDAQRVRLWFRIANR